MTPFVIENNNLIDIHTKLLKERIIFLYGVINGNLSNSIISQLLYLESIDKKKDIKIYINSPGGNISDGLAIYDTFQFVKPDICTLCLGMAASMAAFLLAAGKKGKRFSLKNSRIMIHQPIGGFEGQASDIKIYSKEILHSKNKIVNILSKITKRKKSSIYKDIDRDKFMSSKKAIKYGLIDRIIK
ncbi:ATP-dependent Clp protease proteolytic subunit [Candidatus Vidania fulgoroideorum]